MLNSFHHPCLSAVRAAGGDFFHQQFTGWRAIARMDTTILIHESGSAVVTSQMMKLRDAESSPKNKDVSVWGKQFTDSTPDRGSGDLQRRRGSRRWLWVLALFFCLGVGLMIAIRIGLFDRGPAEYQSPTTRAIPSNYKPDRAMGYLVQLCDLGPRPSGTAAMERQQQLLQKLFSEQGATVTFETFEIRHPEDGSPVPMANLIATWHPERPKRFLFCALRHSSLPRSGSPQSPWCVCGSQRWR